MAEAFFARLFDALERHPDDFSLDKDDTMEKLIRWRHRVILKTHASIVKTVAQFFRSSPPLEVPFSAWENFQTWSTAQKHFLWSVCHENF